MPEEIEFIIDEETGDLTYHIKGIKGPRCAELEKELEALGYTKASRKTSEFHMIATQKKKSALSMKR